MDNNQLRSLFAFRRNHSVALLGGAGSGKSFVLCKILEEARMKHGCDKFLACALTNQAASNVRGATIHSWFGVRPGFNFDKEELWKLLKENKVKCESLRKVKVIVVDEFTVLLANVLDSIDWVFRHLSEHERNACLPMGGRQLVVAGDPFQLEPICLDYTAENNCSVFSARCWLLTFGSFGSGVIALLKGNHRQASDESFFAILDRLRIGKSTDADLARLNKTGSHTVCSSDTHTILCLRKKQVEEWNKKALEKLPGTRTSIFADDDVRNNISSDIRKRLGDVAPKQVDLKNGCDVILTRKFDGMLPGTRLTVKSIRNGFVVVSKKFSDDNFRLRPVRFEIHGQNGSVIACRTQLPVISAYALTVHRCQGLTIERVAMNFNDVGRWRPTGMVYVALSRSTSMNGLWVRGLKKEHITVNERALGVMKDIATLKNYFCDRVIGIIKELDNGVLKSVKDDSILRKRHVSDLETEEGVPLSRKPRKSI